MRRVLALSLLASVALAQDGPWKNDLSLWESKDGVRFQRVGVFVERGGVPSLVSDGMGRLVSVFQWFTFERKEDFDRVAVRVSEDDGETWSDPQAIRVEGLPESYERPYDPTLVPLGDGRLRVYFTSRDMEGDNEQATYSAVGDGVEFSFEPGKRFGVAGERVIDCACCLHEGTFYYYSPVQEHDGRGYHAVSKDGLTFERLDDVRVDGRRPWLGCVVSTEQGLRFYGTGEGGWTATSKDGATWKLDERSRTDGCDPGVAQAKDGRWLMVSTGPRNRDASAEPPFDTRPKGGAPIEEGPPGGPASIGSDGKTLFVVRGDWLYEIDPLTLQVLRKVKIK